MDELQSNKLEAAALKTTDDVANESPLDTVGLEMRGRGGQHNQISDEVGKGADHVP